ncbi:MAG: MoxR family ATPase [Ruminococcus sp.]|nr:MoxR family ATPase [Ruminococcus sp.]
MESIFKIYNSLKDNINSRVMGKDTIIDRCIVTLLCNGHLLLEDIPGTAKTTLAKSIALSIGADFKRVQCTPDLLPSDILGINYYNQNSGEFILRKGAVFTNILLADEINRSTPRTQSSLLECMAEKQVSIDGTTYTLENPFFVIATQNPIENFGTYPLPEAQLDRFFMCLSLGYPNRDAEDKILEEYSNNSMDSPLNKVVTIKELLQAQNDIKNISISSDVRKYILDLVDATRNNKNIQLGVSTRGAISLMKASQGVAGINGRDFVCPEDVLFIFKDVVSHRIVLKNDSLNSKDKIVQSIVESVSVPR